MTLYFLYLWIACVRPYNCCLSPIQFASHSDVLTIWINLFQSFSYLFTPYFVKIIVVFNKANIKILLDFAHFSSFIPSHSEHNSARPIVFVFKIKAGQHSFPYWWSDSLFEDFLSNIFVTWLTGCIFLKSVQSTDFAFCVNDISTDVFFRS